MDSVLKTVGSAGDDPLHSLDPSLELAWRNHAKQRRSQLDTAFKLELPSGMPVMAVRAPLRWLYKHGRIPDHLLAEVERQIKLIETADPKHVEEQIAKDLEESEDKIDFFTDHLKVLNACWLACVTNPVDYLDKLYVYRWAQGVDQSVEDFFLEQAEIMGSLSNGDEVQLPAESDLRIDRTGRPLAGDPGKPSGVQIRDLYRSQAGRDGGDGSSQEQAPSHDRETEVQAGGDSGDDLRPAPGPASKGTRRRSRKADTNGTD
jgi:hypothetical protein